MTPLSEESFPRQEPGTALGHRGDQDREPEPERKERKEPRETEHEREGRVSSRPTSKRSSVQTDGHTDSWANPRGREDQHRDQLGGPEHQDQEADQGGGGWPGTRTRTRGGGRARERERERGSESARASGAIPFCWPSQAQGGLQGRDLRGPPPPPLALALPEPKQGGPSLPMVGTAPRPLKSRQRGRRLISFPGALHWNWAIHRCITPRPSTSYFRRVARRQARLPPGELRPITGKRAQWTASLRVGNENRAIAFSAPGNLRSVTRVDPRSATH